MSDSNIDDRELFRLASLIGCEPQDEERHRKDLKQAIQQELLKARIDELENVNHFINTGGESFMDYYTDRIADLQAKLKETK